MNRVNKVATGTPLKIMLPMTDCKGFELLSPAP